ncbi:uncharacterized protein [Penaeus vannamei]|uniref:uncharacterized protein n=1 Tax=Penaeus vannamei TaxID=6689 RepID=UPI00387F8A1E
MARSIVGHEFRTINAPYCCPDECEQKRPCDTVTNNQIKNPGTTKSARREVNARRTKHKMAVEENARGDVAPEAQPCKQRLRWVRCDQRPLGRFLEDSPAG